MNDKQTLAGLHLLWTIRDARLVKNAENQLIIALAMRCHPEQGYKCYPNYTQLAKDTGCNINTLKRAAQALEEKGLIRRKTRKRRSNVFTICINKFIVEAAKQRAADRDEWDLDDEDTGGPGGALYLSHNNLMAYRATGAWDLPEELQEYIGYFAFDDDPGVFCGHKIVMDSSRWSQAANVAPEGTCIKCFGNKRICLTWEAANGDTLTIETDEKCTECEEKAQSAQ